MFRIVGITIDCEQSLFFFRFSEGSTRERQAAKPREARNEGGLKKWKSPGDEVGAWSFACLVRFARRTKKKERLLVV